VNDELLACDAHLPLVQRAWHPDASEGDLLRYADEAATCPDCEQLLARRLSVHPAVLQAGGRTDDMAPAAPLTAQPPAPRAAAPRTRGSVGWIAGAAFAAGALISLLAGERVGRSQPDPLPTVADAAPPPVSPVPVAEAAPAPAAPPPLPASPPPPAPRSVDVGSAPVRVAEHAAPPAPWPLPPWVDLAGPIAKSADGSVRDLHIALTDAAARVGDAPGLDLLASHPESVAVCIAGPEAGMIWRGTVPSGRSALTRDGHRVRFRFERPGTYTLAVSRDLIACDAPVHRLTIEVSP
jgi:hypothetical protein